ncbi:MAG: hypothetical protein JRF63_03810 [Deltaproteobacteria bacterium]|nr:hypothetical protein [Deltaproteobacteria bacterium]
MKQLLGALRGFLTEHWAAVALVLFTLGLHIELVLWAVPATGDHMIHLYKGWLMSEHLLPSGRLSGWSNMAFAGYPAGVYYPVLGDLAITVTRWITFGLLSWERTYAIWFTLLVVLIPLAVYVVTRRATGKFGALAAGVLAAGDVGGWPQGGHVSTFHWAVWPFVLGLTLSMLAVVAAEKAILKPLGERPLRFVGFAVLLALAVLAHPISSFFLGIAATLYVLLLVWWKRAEHKPLRLIGRASLAAGIGAVLAGFWIVPWITTGQEWTLGWPAVGFGGMWLSLSKMVEALTTNQLFYKFYWATWILGAVGIPLAFSTKRRWPIYIAVLFIFTFLFVGGCNALGDGVIARKVQIERMAAFMKFSWFALAGIAVDRIGVGALWLVGRLPARFDTDAWRRRLAIARPIAGGLFIVGLVLTGWQDSFRFVTRMGRLGGGLWDDIVESERWLSEQPRGPLDRVLYQPDQLCVEDKLSAPECNEVYHRHIFASGPVRTGLPKLKFGYEATAIFKDVPLAHRWPQDAQLIRRLLLEPEAMESLHVRWIVSLAPWPERSDLKEVKRFGDVIVYAVAAGKEPPVRLEGEGRLEVEQFGDEEVIVRIEGAGEDSRVLYPIAHFYPWRAYHEGQPLELDRHGVLESLREILIAVPARDGTTELVFERPWWERVANWASLLLWLACGAFVVITIVRRRRASH